MASPGILTTTTRIRVFFFVMVWLIWEVTAQLGYLVPSVFVPTSAIIAGLVHILLLPELYSHLAFTLGTSMAGFAMAAILGTATGIFMGAFRLLGEALNPYVAAFASSPKIIFLPIVMAFTGWGAESKIGMAFIGAIFPILLSAYAGMVTINPVHIRVARSFNASWWQMTSKVYLPSLRYPLLVGMRLGVGAALVSVVLSEAKFGEDGLGFLALQYYGTFSISKMFSVLAVLFALGILLNFALDRFVARTRR